MTLWSRSFQTPTLCQRWYLYCQVGHRWFCRRFVRLRWCGLSSAFVYYALLGCALLPLANSASPRVGQVVAGLCGPQTGLSPAHPKAGSLAGGRYYGCVYRFGAARAEAEGAFDPRCCHIIWRGDQTFFIHYCRHIMVRSVADAVLEQAQDVGAWKEAGLDPSGV